MAKTDRTPELDRVRHTRTSRAWLATGVGAILLLFLVIFIGQNGQHVQVHYLGANGSVSLAVALLASAVAGALIVLLVSVVRVAQLRLAARRHQRGHDNRRESTDQGDS